MIRKAVIVVLTLAAVAPWAWVAYAGDVPLGSKMSPKPTPHFRLGIQRGDSAWLSHGVFLPIRGSVWSTCTDEHFGFFYCSYSTGTSPPSGNGWRINVPLWFVTVVFLLYPSIDLIRPPLQRWRRRQRPFLLGQRYARWRRHRFVIAATSFVSSVIAVSYVLSVFLQRLLGAETITLAAVLAISLGAPYLVARKVFCALMRRPEGAIRYCRAHGLCVICLYDLTGNVTGICSECGTKIEA